MPSPLVKMKNNLFQIFVKYLLIDIDECNEQKNICGLYGKCTNQYGSYTCECQAGFIPNHAYGFDCEDYDECSSDCHNDCDTNVGFCINLVGIFECACKPGFYGNGKLGQCTDIDECHIENQCSKNSVCENTIGSYNCRCQTGFYGNGTNCDDINECIDLELETECLKNNSKCYNTLGSYECKCLSGFQFNRSSISCVDTNECLELASPCKDDLECVNLIGSFMCQCSVGFIWSQSKQICEDVNECIMSGQSSYDYLKENIYAANVCDENSLCINLIGSYKCECKAGWNKTNYNDYCSGSLH